MATNKKATKIADDWRSAGSPAGLGEAEQAAHAIVTKRPDLMPSVERIMVAELTPEGRVQALALFDVALVTPGDPNRDPRVAIANSAS